MADGTRFGLAEAASLAPDRWRRPLLLLGLLLAALLLLFAEEVRAAVRVWNSSTAYNHCWLVLPIAAWLAWQRKGRLAQLAPEPLPAAALLMIPGTLAWLAAERMGIMEGRQLVLIGMVWVAFLAVLGWRVALAFAAPLSYLVFLVPFGEFTVPLLQRLTAWQIELLLAQTDIPFYIDDLVIEIPAGTFLVAEACAGLRFLVAALAFGALYAFVMFRSPWRRLAVMALALTVPLVANGFRGFGLVLLGHYQGSAAAVDADHVLYGWVFFSIVILLLILAGLPFRQDQVDLSPVRHPSPPVAARPAALLLAGSAALLLAASGPLAAGLLDRAAEGEPVVETARPAPPERCGHGAAPGTLVCGEAEIAMRLVVFPRRANWSQVAAERYRANAGGSDVDFTFRVQAPGADWLARHAHGSDLLIATASWLGGRPAGDGLRSRAAQAWNALRGGPDGAPVLAVVTMRSGIAGERRDRDLLRQVLEAQQEGLVAQAMALSR